MTLNKALIIGNLTRDPELRTTTSGQNVATFGVATSRVWTGSDGKKQEKTEFHNIVAWAKLADICSQYLTKGRKVYVEGHLQTREWDGQDGSKRNRTEIVAENVIILDRPPQGGAPMVRPAAGSAQGFSIDGPAADISVAGAAPMPNATKAEEEIKIEDIPF
jgi:single-strand DNA-binding protein